MIDLQRIIEKTFVAIDLGGTNLRCGLIGDEGMPPRLNASTPTDITSTVRLLKELVFQVSAHRERIDGVLISCPGLISKGGVVDYSLYTPLSGCDIPALLAPEVNAPVIVENDANVQALGFSDQSSHLALISIGTGVGGGIVENGRLIKGAVGYAGEFGHFPVSVSNLPCKCGRKGCLDSTAGGWNLERLLGSDWHVAYDPATHIKALLVAGRDTGVAAVALSIMLNPDLIAITGHLVRYSSFIRGFERSWNDRGWTSSRVEFQPDTWPLVLRGLEQIKKERICR